MKKQMTEDLLANADLDGLGSDEYSEDEDQADKYFDDMIAEYGDSKSRPPPAVV